MEICRKEHCTGCGMCMNICAKNAVTMQADVEGFLHPVVDEMLCVSCGLCQSRCPQNTSVSRFSGNYYAVVAKDDMLRENSSSGGVFSLLARRVLARDGVVFGVAFDENWRVIHIAAEDETDLSRLRGSKYVQSEIGLTYRDAKAALDNGRRVLFTGTPCQIAGLRAYLKKEYDNLLTIDVVCHGAPSPMIFREWLDYEVAHHGDIADIAFRKKAPGWKSFCAQVTHQNGDVTKCMLREGYMRGFLDDLYLRDSCYTCPYASAERVADISLGDYWHYQESGPEHIEDDDRGVSLVIVNTEKGNAAFRAIKRQIALGKRSYEDALRGNPVLDHPAKRPEKREAFWRDHETMSWGELCEAYFPPVVDRDDPIKAVDREYYAQPFVKRHRRHLIHLVKLKILRILKKR